MIPPSAGRDKEVYTVGGKISLIHLYYAKDGKLKSLTIEKILEMVFKGELVCNEVFFTIGHYEVTKYIKTTGYLAKSITNDEDDTRTIAINNSLTVVNDTQRYLWEVTQTSGPEIGKRKYYADTRYVLSVIDNNFSLLGELGECIANNFPQSRKLAIFL